MIEKITQQTFRASEIVNGLLNFSRTSAVDLARLDLNQVVRETVLLLEHQMRSAGITVNPDLDPALPVLAGSRGKLQQVLVNLMMNARDALGDRPSPSILLATHCTDHQIVLTVTDNGSGMPAEVQRKIFDPFFTTKAHVKEGQRKGTGLGLAVSYGIVQEHGGTIEVSSEVGRGTVFRLLFPPAHDPQDSAPSRITQSTSSSKPTSEGTVVHA